MLGEKCVYKWLDNKSRGKNDVRIDRYDSVEGLDSDDGDSGDKFECVVVYNVGEVE